MAAIPIAPAADLLVGTTAAQSATAGDVWDTRLGFASPLPVVPAGQIHGDRHLHGDRSMTRAACLALGVARARARFGGRGHDRGRPLALTATPAHISLAGSGRATRSRHESRARARSSSRSGGRGSRSICAGGRGSSRAMRSRAAALMARRAAGPLRPAGRRQPSARRLVAAAGADRARRPRRARAPHHATAAKRGGRRAHADRCGGGRPRSGPDRADGSCSAASASGGRTGRAILELGVANRGNVTETLVAWPGARLVTAPRADADDGLGRAARPSAADERRRAVPLPRQAAQAG